MTENRPFDMHTNAIAPHIFRIFVGGILLCFAWVVPAHLQSVDKGILKVAGQQDTQLDGFFKEYLDSSITGPVKYLTDTNVESEMAWFIKTIERKYPLYKYSGGADPAINAFLQNLFNKDIQLGAREGWMEILAIEEARNQLTLFLHHSSKESVQSILKTVELKQLKTFMPAHLASGAPFVSSVLTTALMVETGYLEAKHASVIRKWADSALEGNLESAEKLESFYLSILSLAYRMNPLQMGVILKNAGSISAIDGFALALRQHPQSVKTLYSAAIFNGSLEPLIDYLQTYGIEFALPALTSSTQYGIGAVRFLLKNQVPLYEPHVIPTELPLPASVFRWTYENYEYVAIGKTILIFPACYLLIAGIIALANRNTRTAFSQTQTPRTYLLVFFTTLLLIVIFEGKHLFAGSHNTDTPLPATFSALANFSTDNPNNLMNNANIIILDNATIAMHLIFFVMQFSVYIAARNRISQIRNMPGDSSLKLRLLDNEENFFDVGLYMGLAGTAASLILLSMKVISASLMAGYSSTLFGIIFVAVLKIFHVRPYRSSLIVEEYKKKSK